MSSVSARIAIIAALPREIEELVRGVPQDVELRRRGIHLYRLDKAIVVAAGMGAARAELAVKTALAEGAVQLLISTGLAGACTPDLHAGEIAEAGIVVDGQSGTRYAAGQGSDLVLVSANSIANVREKARLSRNYLCAMVDMEAATVARLAAIKGLSFRAIKGISDAYDFDFEWESTAPFADEHGNFRTAAFIRYIALRPHFWPKAIQLGRNSQRALTTLTETLRKIIAEQ
jgi:adenosylhomocysteine nucleosidase